MIGKVLNGMSVSLPITYDAVDGPFKLNKDLLSTIKTNVKNLLFTIPGEKIMDPNFGIGISKFLFENYTPTVKSEIIQRINKQFGLYMPFISLVDLDINDLKIDNNEIFIKLQYFIKPLDLTEVLTEVLIKD